MDVQQRDEFLNAYYKLLIRSWNDPQEMAKLLGDPTGVAVQAGLPVAEGASVRVDQHDNPRGHNDIEDQIRDFAKGAVDGEHVLYVSPQPLIDLAELTDDEIAGVQGGGSVYCCCPCCCCA